MAKGRSAVLLGSDHGSVTCAWGRSSVRGGGNEGVRWEAVAPCIEEGGRWLTVSEEDKGFDSLSPTVTSTAMACGEGEKK
jgi:hypothetical protein